MRKGWRQYYEVWLQERGRDGDDHCYAASCLTCELQRVTHTTMLFTQSRWLTQYAGSRKEAWKIARAHEAMVHGAEVG